ncbi:MAG: hypothetical protein LLF97_11175 [Planctomycetaceae bacterium]|nr:hypothetical protein [Planctomycetaceae bacterium]
MDARTERKRFLLWIDGVGGYWACRGETVSLGALGEDREGPDVPISSDLTRRHALLRRDGESFLIEALQDVAVDRRSVDGAAWLRDGCRIRLGRSVELLFRRPHALSATARLEFVSAHRTQPLTDAVLWMADACVLGPKPHSHVVCRRWTREVILYANAGSDGLRCRVDGGPLAIDGVAHAGDGPVAPNSRVEGDGFSFRFEPITM